MIGAGAIRATFESMFNNGSVQAFPERVHKIESLASSVHHLVERVEIITPQGAKHAFVIATNVYHKTAQGWKMVAHHASPGTANDAVDTGVKPTVLQSASLVARRTCADHMVCTLCPKKTSSPCAHAQRALDHT